MSMGAMATPADYLAFGRSGTYRMRRPGRIEYHGDATMGVLISQWDADNGLFTKVLHVMLYGPGEITFMDGGLFPGPIQIEAISLHREETP